MLPTVDAPPDAVVAARGLTKRYRSITAVDGVDLTVRRGDVYGLLGPNGAGKTTFMRMLFGLIRPDAGRIEVLGRPVGEAGVAALQRVAGFVETPRFYPYLSGRTNLDLLGRLDGDHARARIGEMLGLVDLADRAGSRVGQYSYGMVQRLGVAAALMRDPQLLVLDEPTNGLDPAGIRDMRGLVRRLADTGITVFLSSHIMSEVDEICTRVAIMRRGGIAFDGPMGELKTRKVEVGYLLATNDDAQAREVCHRMEGIHDVRVADGRIAFVAEEPAVERLSSALSSAGIGIRSLYAPTSPLETLFFELTTPEQPTSLGVSA